METRRHHVKCQAEGKQSDQPITGINQLNAMENHSKGFLETIFQFFLLQKNPKTQPFKVYPSFSMNQNKWQKDPLLQQNKTKQKIKRVI